LVLVIRLPTGMEGTRVAIYYDRGALPSSATALFNMYSWMNAETNYINSTDIQQGVLDGYDLVVFPGGSSYDYSGSLGSSGRNAICDFVANGGSYFRICGGSVFGTNLYLRLFNGYTSGAANGTVHVMGRRKNLGSRSDTNR